MNYYKCFNCQKTSENEIIEMSVCSICNIYFVENVIIVI